MCCLPGGVSLTMKFFPVVVAVAGCVAAVSAQYSFKTHHNLGRSYATNRVTYGAAPFVGTSARFAAAPVATPVAGANYAVSSQARPPKIHEIHTQSARQHIRVEEFQAPNQVIRVHEAPQAPPQILSVRAPSHQSIVRVVDHSSGPAHVERVVHQTQEVQVVDVHRPPPPPARIVQIVRGPAPHPRIIFHQEHDPQAEINVEAPPAPSAVVAPAVHAAPVVRTVGAAPVVRTVAAPYVHAVAAPAPIVRTVAASAPIVRTVSSPSLAQSVRVPAVPVGVGYTMYGVGYGRLYSGHFGSRASSA